VSGTLIADPYPREYIRLGHAAQTELRSSEMIKNGYICVTCTRNTTRSPVAKPNECRGIYL